MIERGLAYDADEVQAETARHHRWVSRSWRPDAGAYAALGALYIDHNEFRAMYDALHPGLARFMANAMAVYARRLPRAGQA